MKTSRSPRARRGIMLIEMLVALILLSAFAVVATRLFYASYKLSAQAAEAHDANGIADLALWHLRTDAWAATKIESTIPQTALLTMPDGVTVTWTIEGKDLLRRAGNENDRWRIAPSGEATFATDGITLTFKVTDPKSSNSFDEVAIVSQPQLIARLIAP